MAQPIVLSLGELLWDMLPGGKRAGGAPVNFIYHAMHNGADGYAISAVGEDELGDELVKVTKDAGINAIIQRNAWPTTIVELLKHTKPGAMKFFDINIRGDHYSKELIEELLSYATVFKLNDAELLLLRDMFGIRGTSDDEACRWFLTQYGLDYIILTGGATFSTIISKTGDSSTLSTPHVEVADTVGAGDSFSGTFAAKILTGASLEEAHRAAVNTAAFVCTNDGAWPEYPEHIPDYLAEAGL